MSIDRLTFGEEYYFDRDNNFRACVLEVLEELKLPLRRATTEIDGMGNRGDTVAIWKRSRRIPALFKRRKFKPLQYPKKAYA